MTLTCMESDDHGHERTRAHDASRDSHGHDSHGHGGPPHESPWVITLPLILLAVPSFVIGWFTIGPVLFGEYFGGAIVVCGTA